jgi:hypothetical protein
MTIGCGTHPKTELNQPPKPVSCKTPGACFTKDIIYREGNIAIWETLYKNIPEMQRWNVGKYDPSNPRRIWVLDQLGITDTDLEKLNAKE